MIIFDIERDVLMAVIRTRAAHVSHHIGEPCFDERVMAAMARCRANGRLTTRELLQVRFSVLDDPEHANVPAVLITAVATAAGRTTHRYIEFTARNSDALLIEGAGFQERSG